MELYRLRTYLLIADVRVLIIRTMRYANFMRAAGIGKALLTQIISIFAAQEDMLTGSLWNWRTSPSSLQLFEHPGCDATAERVLIIIGGLTDGLLPCR